jgi:MFS family permease
VPAVPKRLVVAALAGRIHSTASTVVIAMAVRHWTGSFAAAGAVVAALVLGQGLSAPLRGRAADRWPVPTLLGCGAAYATGLSSLAAVTWLARPSWLPLAVGVALASGLALPPVAPVLRSAVAALARTSEETHRTLAWEAAAQELIFIAGPPTALGVAAVTSAAAALEMLAITAAAGTATFAAVLRRAHPGRPTASASPSYGAAQVPARQPGRRSPRSTPGSTVARLAITYGLLLGSLTTMSLVAVTTALEVGRPAVAGLLEAMIAVGSMIGGAAVARGSLIRLTLARRMACMTVALGILTMVCALTESAVLVGGAMLVVGFWVAPTLAVHGVALLQVADPARRAETFGWVNAVGLAISAALTPLTGWLLDLHGTPGAAALAAASIALGSALAVRLTDAAQVRRAQSEPAAAGDATAD